MRAAKLKETSFQPKKLVYSDNLKGGTRKVGEQERVVGVVGVGVVGVVGVGGVGVVSADGVCWVCCWCW